VNNQSKMIVAHQSKTRTRTRCLAHSPLSFAGANATTPRRAPQAGLLAPQAHFPLSRLTN
jgi:hypothetical protein